MNTSFFFLFSKLWSFLSSKRKKRLIFLLMFTILSAIAETISMGAIFPFLAAITSPEKLLNNEYLLMFFSDYYLKNNLVLLMTIFFSTAILLSGIVRILLMWLLTRVSFSIGADISYEIYKKTLYQPYEVHLSRNSSEVIAGVSTKVGAIIFSTVFPLLTIISSSFMILILGVVLIAFDPLITLTSITIFGAIYLIITYFVKNRVSRDSKIIASESNFTFKALQEGLGGIRDIILDGSQQVYLDIYRNADLPLKRAQGNIVLQSGLPRYFVETLGFIFIGFLAYFLVQNSTSPIYIVSTLGFVAIGAQRLLPVIQQLYSNLILVRGGKSNLIDVIHLLSQEILTKSDILNDRQFSFVQRLSFQNVSFKYKASDRNIISNFSFEIFKGNRVGIIGSTGSGKTTLLDLMMGLLTPSSGEIIVDDKVLDYSNLEYWRKNIAHVPQNIFLSDSTFLENIAFGIPFNKIDHNLVYEAAKQARIYDTILAREYGFMTTVGERGVRLSGGQKQRIGIARALYKKASVIIFDEATSALDNSTEAELMEEIDSLDSSLTLILVAHRLSTLKSCDVIFEISNGKINRLGNYSSLSHS